ncbi:DUF2911 domain-containing protein [Mucilaginibacter sp. X4EP1]|uniref:DUF2911 domain-containing protein n=1 Tax=Mucilaginibacter sp. X4EP1 TaxID=2723092 RepID=UPI002169ADC3|nr:DUF2911 domain-containing protein [Mucilaginibacter sp. X4EP1]MCS3816283.1 hypothetical protein [Mucilaginibacter sp. X4EP1]
MKKIINTILLLLLAAALSVPAYAQKDKPRVSPPELVTGMINKATVTINYSSPSVKGRKIWGGLVPYDTVWRAGANEATTFQTDKDLLIGTQVLPAGKYGFFLVPNKTGQWIAVFNKVPNQWGAFKYDKNQDQLRVNVSTQNLDAVQEMLVYKINPDGFSLTWEKLTVIIPAQQNHPNE